MRRHASLLKDLADVISNEHFFLDVHLMAVMQSLTFPQLGGTTSQSNCVGVFFLPSRHYLMSIFFVSASCLDQLFCVSS